MTRDQLEKIIEERLAAYRRRLRETFATPIFCVGVTHSAADLGHTVLCTMEDMSDEMLLGFLDGIAGALRKNVPAAKRAAAVKSP